MNFKESYGQSWALVIGINKYRYVAPLAHATNDASVMATTLRDSFGFPEGNITTLLDDAASAQNIRECFLSYRKAAPDDRLVVFFAGHGQTLRGNRGDVGFLIPADGNPDDLSSLIRWDDLTRNADLIPAKHILFLMDACYGGLALMRNPSLGTMRFMGNMIQRYARQVLTAGKADETVSDGSGVRPGHSIFTAHLLNALEGGAATNDGIITANGVMSYVYDRVGRDEYSHQTPHFGFIQGDGDLIFNVEVLEKLRAAEPLQASGEAGGETTDLLVNPAGAMVTMDEESLIVSELKDLLGDPTKRIRLDTFVSFHIRRFLDATDLRHFPTQGPFATAEDIAERIGRYEEAASDLQQVVILLSRWGDSSQLKLLEKVFIRLAEADKGTSGLAVWMKLGWYPIVYLAYSAGIAAVEARNYEALATMFHASVTTQRAYGYEPKPFVVVVVDGAGDLSEYFKMLPGHDRQYVPVSEYLYKALQPVLEDSLMIGRGYDLFFDRFEVLLALEYADLSDSGWGPPGRFAWKHRHDRDTSPLKRAADDAQREGSTWGPLRAGLFKSSPERLSKDMEIIEDLMRKLRWF